jgi:uncharacterized protein (UPF0333 family)
MRLLVGEIFNFSDLREREPFPEAPVYEVLPFRTEPTSQKLYKRTCLEVRKVRRVRRGQISFEYIMILAFVFAILIPGIYFFYTYSQSSTAGVASAQFNKMGQEMLTTAQKTIAQGTGSWLTLDVNIPENVVDINVSCTNLGPPLSGCNELVIYYNTEAGMTTAVFFSDLQLSSTQSIPLTSGSIFAVEPHGGRASFRFTAERDASGANTIVITETY